MSEESIARKLYAKQYATLEKRRKAVCERPLTQREISVLMETRRGGVPVVESVDVFYTDEYRALIKAKTQPISKEEFYKLLDVKNKEGAQKYRADDFKSSDGKYRALSDEEARDLLGLEKVIKYRPATPEEANLLYCDLHSRIVKDGLEKEAA